MAQHTQVLDDLLTSLRSSVGGSVSLHVVASQAGGLTIQVGDQPEAVIGVEMSNEQRPSFRICYPKLTIKRNGDRHTATVQSDGVLAEGVAWVVGQLARHGVVKPEFSD
jgi:hypothetical protein